MRALLGPQKRTEQARAQTVSAACLSVRRCHASVFSSLGQACCKTQDPKRRRLCLGAAFWAETRAQFLLRTVPSFPSASLRVLQLSASTRETRRRASLNLEKSGNAETRNGDTRGADRGVIAVCRQRVPGDIPLLTRAWWSRGTHLCVPGSARSADARCTACMVVSRAEGGRALRAHAGCCASPPAGNWRHASPSHLRRERTAWAAWGQCSPTAAIGPSGRGDGAMPAGFWLYAPNLNGPDGFAVSLLARVANLVAAGCNSFRCMLDYCIPKLERCKAHACHVVRARCSAEHGHGARRTEELACFAVRTRGGCVGSCR